MIQLLCFSQPQLTELVEWARLEGKVVGLAEEAYPGNKTDISNAISILAEIGGQRGTYRQLLSRNEAMLDMFHAAFVVSGQHEANVSNLSIVTLGKYAMWAGTLRQWQTTIRMNMARGNSDLKFWYVFYQLFHLAGYTFLWDKWPLKPCGDVFYME